MSDEMIFTFLAGFMVGLVGYVVGYEIYHRRSIKKNATLLDRKGFGVEQQRLEKERKREADLLALERFGPERLRRNREEFEKFMKGYRHE